MEVASQNLRRKYFLFSEKDVALLQMHAGVDRTKHMWKTLSVNRQNFLKFSSGRYCVHNIHGFYLNPL